MKTFNSDTNFSIVLPGGCNAKCKFCFNVKPPIESLPIGYYLRKLTQCLNELDKQFYQISLTGGEPLLSPYIDFVLSTIFGFKHKYTNIVLTTNGTQLLNKIDMVSLTVDHINISRHHFNESDNKNIFGGSYNEDDKSLLMAIDEYGKRGIDISVNCVINDSTTKDFIDNYIEWGKSLGVYAIRFRKENGDLKPTPVELEYSDYKNLRHGECPVCRTDLQRIKGVLVYWKSSTLEPSDMIKNKIYELVFQPDGNIYEDWSYNRIVNLYPEKFRNVYRKSNRIKSSNRNSSCGGNSRSCG